MSGMQISVNLDDLHAGVDALDANLQANVRPAAQAGSEILYQAVKTNVAALGRKTGNLASSIYQAHSEQHSGNGVETYHVSWNARKAPHGHLVEFGHLQKYKVYLGKDGKWYTNRKAPLPAPKQVGAQAFVRRAASRFGEAQIAMEKRLLEGVA